MGWDKRSNIALDVVFLRHRAPSLHLFLQKLAQVLGTGEQHVHLLRLDELLCDAWLAQACNKFSSEAIGDRLRRAGRRENAPPCIGIEVRKAVVAYARHVGQRGYGLPARVKHGAE